MYEVQLVRRSKNGVVMPIAFSQDGELVGNVARRMLLEMESWRLGDEVLDAVADRMRQNVAAILTEKGANRKMV